MFTCVHAYRYAQNIHKHICLITHAQAHAHVNTIYTSAHKCSETQHKYALTHMCGHI